MNLFSKCYQRIKEMTPTFNIKIAGHSIFYSDEFACEPSKDCEIACNFTTPSPETENEFFI